MSDHHKDGGPAFPSEGEGHGNPMYHSPGMSLRDYFAAKALTAILASKQGGLDPIRVNAEYAYNYADAMLKARDK